MKKTISILLAVLLVMTVLISCNKNSSESDGTLKVALLCIGDENDQGYSYNFIQGYKEAQKKLEAEGIKTSWKLIYNINEDDSCTQANIQAAEDGCKIVFNNSYGFEDYMLKVAPDYPEIQFVSCTNCKSRGDDLANTSNVFANIYEGRYVAGVVAGLKLNELIANGTIKANEAVIGYVGAFPFSEVKSGYTAYFLGARSVCPSVTMKVQFVGSWSDATAEADAAKALIAQGCKLISQHSDNTTPATEAQKAGVFHTGYNADMTGIASKASLISTRIDWSVYFYEFIKNYVNGVENDADWCKGMADEAVLMTALNTAIAAPGTEEKMAATIKGIKDGTIKVFDTNTFKVGGKKLTSSMALDTDGDWVPDSGEAVYGGQYHESDLKFQSAPYFALDIDGITLLN